MDGFGAFQNMRVTVKALVNCYEHLLEQGVLTPPSTPCGSCTTKPDWQTHLLSPFAMKVSNTTCAVSAKSPYCASHIDSSHGLEYE